MFAPGRRIPSLRHWCLYLKLKEIVEIVCGPSILICDTVYLKHLVEWYIEHRLKMFSNVPLRPKHHFLLHYPGLIVKFGPLIKAWTMRFESKHSYFKNKVRSCGNFVNLTKTLSYHHQVFQSSLLHSSLIDSDVAFDRISSQRYSSEMLKVMAILGIDTGSVSFLHNLVFKGIAYQVGQCVILFKIDCDLVVGIIKVIFKRASHVCLFVTKCVANYFPSLGFYH